MKHKPEDDIPVASTTLTSTRWGLRTGLTAKDRLEMRTRMLGSAPVTKFRNGGRSVRDRIRELEVPRNQIGAAWCAPDPIFATYISNPHSYAGTWEDGVRVGGDHRLDEVIFGEIDDPEQDIVWWDPDFDFNDRAYECGRRRIVAERLKRFKSLVPDDEAVDEIALRDRTGKVGRIIRACEEHPEALLLIEDDLATRAKTTIASDGEPVGLGMSGNDRLPLLYALLVALSAEAMDRMEALSEVERRNKERVSACWADFNAFTRDIHRILVRERIIIPPPPDRSRQFAALEAWAKEPDLSRRETFLRLWRMRVISIACDLADTGRSDEHQNPRHVWWMLHRATSPYEASGVNHNAIRRLLEGHPSAQIQALACEFQTAFEHINTAEQDDAERAAAAAWASRLVDVTVAESPEDVYAALLDEL